MVISLKLITIFCFLLQNYLFANSVGESLKLMSDEDKYTLERLFSKFVKDDQFCYTIFGDKPVSLATLTSVMLPKVINKCNKFYLLNNVNNIFHVNVSSWKVWKKIKRYSQCLDL